MFGFTRKAYHDLSDSQLIELIQQSNDQSAYGEIYKRYAHLVLGSCLYYLKDEEEAKDLCSLLFEQLSVKIRRFEITYFKSWLFQLVKNECYMLLRKKKYIYIDFSHLQLSEDNEENKPIDKESKITLLEEAINQLSTEQKLCIRAFYIELKSYVEISEKYQMELTKVKSYIQNGKRNLKLLLQKHEAFTEQ